MYQIHLAARFPSLMVARDWRMLASVAAPSRTIAHTDGSVMHEGGGTYLTQPEVERSLLQKIRSREGFPILSPTLAHHRISI